MNALRIGFSFERAQYLSSLVVQCGHGSNGGIEGFLFNAIIFCSSGKHPGPDGFGKQENVVCLGADISPNLLRVNHPGYGIAKNNVIVSNRMATNDAALGLGHFVKATANNLLEEFNLAFCGKPDKR